MMLRQSRLSWRVEVVVRIVSAEGLRKYPKVYSHLSLHCTVDSVAKRCCVSALHVHGVVIGCQPSNEVCRVTTVVTRFALRRE